MATSELRQSKGERARLQAIWEAHPTVVQVREQLEAYAVEHGLKFTPDGMTAINRYANELLAQVEWPHSGILIG